MKKIILDCDPGMDDSMAIVMAAKAPELDLLAVTTVNGNYPVDVTCVNARKTLELLGRTDIPVARGMANPVIRKSPSDPFTHGKDGQAEANLPDPKMPLCELDAVDLIIKLVKENPGEITLVVTGPMSNVAMAMIKAPEIKEMIHDIVAISGMFGLNDYAFMNATGDTPQSEWNVYVDPEASKVVYESGVKLTALGLDVATYFDVDFTDDQLALLEKSDRKEAAFLANAVRFVRGRGFGAYCAVIDCMAVAYAIDPTLVETFDAHVGVETKDGLTLGMTVIDRRHHFVWEQLPLISIGKKADCGRFLKLLLDLVLA
ncbi:nucleoside hydrolase [Ruminococcus sp. CLA-AA-H200]|uniref:Nucleoside hydrolase n=1 Tax=Ruminococcus turbiniformis TaxID=2881258 RepID=A0ABS8FUI0_9FIRM|nr:nucleoside hydrolase [Ruminococcus turbiniformis]MCC2253715.1 nucleoside hydrolase [Ruminococcus turbiniformis]